MNNKALSLVVAAILIIAVTVAVSIAVAVWMGALTRTETQPEFVFKVPRLYDASHIKYSVYKRGSYGSIIESDGIISIPDEIQLFTKRDVLVFEVRYYQSIQQANATLLFEVGYRQFTVERTQNE